MLREQKRFTSLEILKNELEHKRGYSLSRGSINGFVQKLKKISALNICPNPDSICVCPLCTSEDKDMVYIPENETWYCIECQEKGLIWDPSHGSEEDRWQHDYINMYHEQKDKFVKRFLNKKREIFEY